jgi:hypothetical protein
MPDFRPGDCSFFCEHDFMNDHATPEPVAQTYTKYYLLAGIAGAIVLVLYLVFGGSGTSVTPTNPTTVSEDHARVAREGLNKATDDNTCRASLAQVNQLLSRQQTAAVGQPAEQAEFVRKQFELKDDEWAEVTNDTFTLLDGHYLATALLFRDAAVSFTRDGVLPRAQRLPRAQAAFAWAVRQVRLQGGGDDAGPLPVDYVVRRGFGTPLDRGLVFLELLRQFDVPGCLVTVQEPASSRFPLWTCGALVGRDIYLFDPRAGIPLPRSDGKGVATLAEALKQPGVLKQLTVDEAAPYDVSPEQASHARIYLPLPLSALAPRMRYLEELLQDPDVPAPVIPGRFGVDAVQMFQQFEDALAAAGVKDGAVRAWPPATRSLRETLPSIEGGLDKSTPPIRSRMRDALVPRRAFPQHTPDGHAWKDLGLLYAMMLQKFTKPFIDFYFDPQQPRELLIRGHLNEASRPLTAMRTDALAKRARFEKNPEMPAQVQQAIEMAIPALAEMQKAEKQASGDTRNPALAEARERWEGAFKKAEPWLDALIDGAAAGPFGQEVNYQLALVKHEQAERMQLRADDPSERGQAPAEEADAARRAWQNAADSWGIYLQEYPEASAAPAARYHAARVHSMLAEIHARHASRADLTPDERQAALQTSQAEREAALELLRDSSKLTDLEKVGRLAVIRRLEKQK